MTELSAFSSRPAQVGWVPDPTAYLTPCPEIGMDGQQPILPSQTEAIANKNKRDKTTRLVTVWLIGMANEEDGQKRSA